MSVPFIHLRVHTAYSLLEGAIQPDKLGKICKQHGMPAVGVTDSNNLFGSLELSASLSKEGVQPIIGCVLDFVAEEQDSLRGSRSQLQPPEQLVLLAQDETGYQNLLTLVSDAYLNPPDGRSPLLDYHQLEGRSEGLICLSGGPRGRLSLQLVAGRKEAAETFAARLESLFPGRLYLELQRHGTEEEQAAEAGLVQLAITRNLPVVATNDVYFEKKETYQAHDALLCIAEGRYVSERDRRKVTPEHYFKTAGEMAALFADMPEALENTLVIARRCAVMSPKREPILPRFGDIEAEKKLMAEKSRAGLEERLAGHVFTAEMDETARREARADYDARLDYEVGVINQMGFPGYFLIVSDFIQWSKDHDIPVGPGRGSGAGSLVAWALKITDLDPLRYGLLFERFLNPERVSMPDFDIDFCQDRRDEVINYVQQRYGAAQVAQIITFGKLQARAVLRDVGRVLQMPYGQVDRLCKLVPNNPAAPVTLQQAIDMEPQLRREMKEDESAANLVKIALQLEGLYRHASTHAAGVVIGDRPLVELLPLYRDPRSEMLVVQYSMKYAELAGLVKFDFLGLKTLSVLQTACKMLAKQGISIDLLKLPEGDKATYEMLGKGDATGVFQLESAGMRDTLRKLKPDTLEDIIALVSLYRPGPMDNIPTYIARKHGREKVETLHPILEPILSETFGVIIYQEQVMQIAQKLASYSLGEADLLRRAMGKKIASEMEAQRATFTERAVANGVEARTAKEIYDLVAKFASYGFNKSHAAAYALIAYQTAYLKANYPAEFYAASMTYDMHNTEKLALFREEAEKGGIAVLPPDINQSGPDFQVEIAADGAKSIRYALAALKNVGRDAMEALVAERRNRPFTSIFDLAARVDGKVTNKRQLENLVRAGVFDAVHVNRNALFHSLDMISSYSAALSREKEAHQESLFGGMAEASMPVPPLLERMDWSPNEKLAEEFAAVGFYLSSHPLRAFRTVLQNLRVMPSSQLAEKLGFDYSAVRLAGIVTGVKHKRSAKGRFAFMQLTDESGVYEVSVFDEDVLATSREQMSVGSMLMVSAEGKREEGGYRLIARGIQSLNDAVLQQGNRQSATYSFVISSDAQLEALKACLPVAGGQGSSVLVLIEVAEQQVSLSLPGRYAITPESYDSIAQHVAHAAAARAA